MRVQMIVLVGLIVAAVAPKALADEWAVAENNPIVQVYVGQTSPDGTELVFELASMHFYSSQRLYGCIFVGRQIAQIKEYNNEDSYVRAVVKLPADDEELVAYCGVIRAAEKIDPHDHASLWKAFANSPHAPFRAKLTEMPKWYVINPIRAKKAPTTQPASSDSRRPGSFPYLKPQERAAKAKEALDPATGDEARYNAIWGLAISGYCRASAEALAVIACDRKSTAGNRWDAAMGLINFGHSMPEDVRRAIQDQLCGALDAEKENLPDGLIMTFIAWGDADRVRKVLGDKLRGHNKEVAVLERISSRDYAVARLWEIYEASPPPTGAENVALSRRWHVGHALICRRDKRGIDILLQCLTVKEAENADRFSFRHSLHGTFLHLASVLKNDFGYRAGRTWTPQLNEAIPEMVEWWKANRETWSFEEAAPNVVPTVRPGKPLTGRQARMLAAKLASDAFAERTFQHADGRRVGKIEVAPKSFNDVRQKDGRWVLRTVVSRGPEAFVDSELDGTHAKVIVNYAWR